MSAWPSEIELLAPVRRLFAADGYRFVVEAPLGSKRIDLLLLPTAPADWISVELKVRDWQRALSQAALNLQLTDKSFIALWHRAVPGAVRMLHLFERYRVGLISVSAEGATVVKDWGGEERNTLKRNYQSFFLEGIDAKKATNAATRRPISFLSA